MSQLDMPWDSVSDPTAAPDRAAASRPIAEDSIEQEIIAAGGLTERQVARTRAVQRRHQSTFAEAAVGLGYVRREHLLHALAKRYNYPVLSPSNGTGHFSRELVVGFEAFGQQAEAIRSIRASLVANASEAKTNSIAFVGPHSSVGVSFLCANIALSLAQAGIRTLLVDANLRRPRVHRIFGLEEGRDGLVEAIHSGSQDGAWPIAEDVVRNLSILTAGFTPPNPQELLVSPEFTAIVQELRGRYGAVLYDTTDTADCVDGLMVASRVGAAVLVGRRHKTRMADARKLAGTLRSLNCVLLGAVLDG